MEKIALSLLFVLFSPLVFSAATLIEIDRVGKTSSIQQHYARKSSIKQKPTQDNKKLTAEQWLKNLLPIHTDTMSPGNVAPEKRVIKNLMSPIFIIGSDKKSLEWLEENAETLKKHRAVGLLVEVQTLKQLKMIGKIGKGLSISPIAGNDMSQLFGLRHYPVLISRYGIEQ